jgi:glycolate oxidase
MEFMEKDALALTQTFTGNFDLDLNNSYKAYLLVEADGFEESALMPQCEKMLPIFEALKCGDILFATSSSEQDKLWYLRRRMGEAVKAESIYKEEDTVVPRGCLPQLLASVKRIGDDYGFRSICYGHAGDGNLHVNILRDELSDEFWDKKLPQAIAEIFTEVKALGGTLSGEHGIGLVQTPYMHLVCSKAHLKAMKAIKTALDPKGILNPGKILPED